jgi:hypothetical protein
VRSMNQIMHLLSTGFLSRWRLRPAYPRSLLA